MQFTVNDIRALQQISVREIVTHPSNRQTTQEAILSNDVIEAITQNRNIVKENGPRVLNTIAMGKQGNQGRNQFPVLPKGV